MSTLELLICLALVATSATFSASEVALFSLSKPQLRHLKEHFKGSYQKIKKLLADPNGLLVTILVVNEFVNIALSTLIAENMAQNWDETFKPLLARLPHSLQAHVPQWAWQAFFGTLITTPIILLLCEVTPKGTGARINRVIAPLSVGLMTRAYKTLKPIRIILKRLTHQFSRMLPGHRETFDPDTRETEGVREDEFLTLVEEGRKEGALNENEVELIRNILAIDDMSVGDLYTPIARIHSVPCTMLIKDAILSTRGKRIPRVPVTSVNRKKVMGVLYTKDFIEAKLDPTLEIKSVETLCRKPLSVAPSMKLSTLFRRFKQSRTHIAVVEKNENEDLGIVTMDDILDELFENFMPADPALEVEES